MKNLVFVYGTLKHGHGNHYILKEGGAKFRGYAETFANWRMFNAGFPVLRPQYRAKAGKVRGEVYLVTRPETKKRLDMLEGEGRMYHRRWIKVRMADGKVHLVETYIGDRDCWSRKTKADLITSWPIAAR